MEMMMILATTPMITITTAAATAAAAALTNNSFAVDWSIFTCLSWHSPMPYQAKPPPRAELYPRLVMAWFSYCACSELHKSDTEDSKPALISAWTLLSRVQPRHRRPDLSKETFSQASVLSRLKTSAGNHYSYPLPNSTPVAVQGQTVRGENKRGTA
ncbi:hypothetical protein PoB_006617900 [Plakobranchus ocellatus]|uniref:Secreted protein n=1 Tax=Plakobranchus ocellatus TaxID=259542 RepID=A0AAV4D677_9GAST|nr:hypothetical protein PoB_006617900 [Plakobranchus ocellatus]